MKPKPPITDDIIARSAQAWANRERYALPEALHITHQLANDPSQYGAAYVWHRIVDDDGEWVVSRTLPHEAERVAKWFRVARDGTIDACAGTLRQRVGQIRGGLIDLVGGLDM